MKIRKHTYHEDIGGKWVNEFKEYLKLIDRQEILTCRCCLQQIQQQYWQKCSDIINNNWWFYQKWNYKISSLWKSSLRVRSGKKCRKKVLLGGWLRPWIIEQYCYFSRLCDVRKNSQLLQSCRLFDFFTYSKYSHPRLTVN